MPKKKKKVKLNYPRIITAIIIVAVVIGVLLFILLKPGKSNADDPKNNQPQQTTSVGSYSIRSNATAYQKTLYDELKEAIKSKNDEAVAKSIAQNFVADFFTLSNKTIKNDVGGTQFWSEDARLTLRTKAIDTFYSNLELYIKDYGSKNLPIVKDVKVTGTNKMNDYTYAVSLEWSYEDTKFDTSEFQKTATVEITKESGTSYIYNFY